MRLEDHQRAVELLRKLYAGATPRNKIASILSEQFGESWSTRTVQRVAARLTLKRDRPTDFVPPPPLWFAWKRQSPDFYTHQYGASRAYIELCKQFSFSECVEFFRQYGALCVDHEPYHTTDFWQIEDFVKHRLLMNRCLKDIQKSTGQHRLGAKAHYVELANIEAGMVMAMNEARVTRRAFREKYGYLFPHWRWSRPPEEKKSTNGKKQK